MWFISAPICEGRISVTYAVTLQTQHSTAIPIRRHLTFKRGVNMLSGLFYLLFSFMVFSTSVDASSGQCCFVNPSYAGVCVVDPAPGESCSSILGYLNTAGTAGKTYCGSTPIRGGWKQVRCE
jgi:hypothetical protein